MDRNENGKKMRPPKSADGSLTQAGTQRKKRGQISAEAELKLQLIEELVPQIARAVGPICEFVLHEWVGDRSRIRAIANAHISGRKTGGPMGRVFVHGTEVHDFKHAIFNYNGSTQEGGSLRCTLIPILHEEVVIGVLCVNFLTRDLVVARDALSTLLKTEDETDSFSEYVPNPPDVFDEVFQECLNRQGWSPSLLSRRERLMLLSELKSRGVLRVRGAIDRLAARLGTSRTTIYNDLKEV